VDGKAEPSTGLGVSGRESYALGLERAAASDGKLVASDWQGKSVGLLQGTRYTRTIMLSASGRASSVQGNCLSPEQVVTGRNVRRNLEVKLSAVVVQVLGSPEVGITLRRAWCLRPTVLVDLEELARAIGLSSILDLAHVGHYGTPMSTTDSLSLAVTAVGLLVHLDGNSVTCLESTFSGCCGRVDVALQSGARVILNGAVGRWEPGTSAFKVLSVLPELLPSGVGVGHREDGGKSCDGLHDDDDVCG
jgi:hypothetical protein